MEPDNILLLRQSKNMLQNYIDVKIVPQNDLRDL